MSRPGYTTKPCHGCGSTELHPTGALCTECKQVMKDGRLYREKQERMVESGEKMMVRHTETSHWTSSPRASCYSPRFVLQRLNECLRTSWSHLTLELVEPGVGAVDRYYASDTPYLVDGKKEVWGTKNEFYSHRENYFLVTSAVRDALNKFDMVVRIALELVYLVGRSEGMEILSQLNEGRMSSEQYDEGLDKGDNRLEQLGIMLKDEGKHSDDDDEG